MAYGFLSRLLGRRSRSALEAPRSASRETSQSQSPQAGTCQALPAQDAPSADRISYSIRIAAYDTPSSIPRVMEVSNSDITVLISEASDVAYSLSHEKGGRIPYVVIKEIVENLIHADFTDAVITISPTGDTIRVSDHGPGIADKTRCFLPGFTTANARLRRYIKGVGSGLAIASESMALMGGQVTVEDNLSGGSVVTLEFGHSPGWFQPAKANTSGDIGNTNAPFGEKPQNSLEGTKMEYSDSTQPVRSQAPKNTSPATVPEKRTPFPDSPEGTLLGPGSLTPKGSAASDAALPSVAPPAQTGTHLRLSDTCALPAEEHHPAAERNQEDVTSQGQSSETDHQARSARLKDIDESLSSRQKKVFMLIAEVGDLGPSTVTKELDISLSTAYRDLVVLEERGLVQATDGGKRKLTELGIEYLSYLFR